MAIARQLADAPRNAPEFQPNPPELTGSTDISTNAEKAVAVTAPVQLGYDDRGGKSLG
jgi:hypothetical protein